MTSERRNLTKIGRPPQTPGQPRIEAITLKLSTAEKEAVLAAGGPHWARDVVLRAVKRQKVKQRAT